MATSPTAKSRISALDFTKGALVLIMVLYHWLNYFYGTQDNRYLRFLTPSFIFITGFLISNVYFTKYGVKDPRLPRRLLLRGLKIFAVFILLNLIISLVFSSSYNGKLMFAQFTAANLLATYVTGNVLVAGVGKGAVFWVLVPISYLLMLSAILLYPCRVFRYTFHAVCLVFLAAIFVLHLYGLESANLELLAAGLLGVVAGYVPLEKINRFVRHPVWLAIAYVAYLAAITVWNVLYPLQVMGVCLSLMILYLLGDREAEPGRARAHVILLGKYSLFGYVAQIAILQLMRRGLSHVEMTDAVLVVTFFLAFALTMASVELVDWLRAKSKVMDGLYRAVFA